MNIAFYIDIAIFLFLIYNIVIGFKNGLLKSLFFSFGFLVRAFVTFIMYRFFYDFISENVFYKKVADFLRGIIVKALPNLSGVSDVLDRIIMIFVVYILVSIVVEILLGFSATIADRKNIKYMDKFFGMLYGFLKGCIYLMLFVYIFDKVSDYVLTEQVKEALTGSSAIVPFYTYNIFMNIFGV